MSLTQETNYAAALSAAEHAPHIQAQSHRHVYVHPTHTHTHTHTHTTTELCPLVHLMEQQKEEAETGLRLHGCPLQ